MTVPNAEDCRWSTWDGKQNGEVLHHSAKLGKESIKKLTHRNEHVHEGEIGIPFLGPTSVYGSDC